MANPRDPQELDDEDIGKGQRGGIGGKAEDIADEEVASEEVASDQDFRRTEEEEDEGPRGVHHIDDPVAEEADQELEGEIGSAEGEEDRSSSR